MTSSKRSLDELRIDRSRDSRSRRWPVIFVLLLLVGAVAAGGWRWWTSTQVLRVEAAPVRLTTAEDAQPAVLNASGYVTARLQATVSSKVTGKVVDVLVEEGMVVRKGQVLARLDDSSERSYLALAEAQLGAARGALADLQVRQTEANLTLSRTRELVEEGITSRAELDTAQAEVDSLGARIYHLREQVSVAEREVDVRRTALEDTVIRSPFSGVAISKDAQPGEMISPLTAGDGFTRTGICTIVDMESLEIEVDVNESYINRVSPDQRVVATLDAYPDWNIPASVITTVPAADRQRATVLVRIAFDELDPRILPDMGVNVAFLENEPPPEATPSARLWVPATALRQENGGAAVFVVNGKVVERRAVTTGLQDAGDVEVLGGVRHREMVVVDVPSDLTDGQTVRVRESG